MDPTTWDWHNPATYFFALYTIARTGSHFVKPYTIVGRFFGWILGSIPQVPPPTEKNGG